MPHLRLRTLLTGSLALVFALAACGPAEPGGLSASPTVPGELPSSPTATGLPASDPTATEAPASWNSAADAFPLTPNPLSVTAVLDKTHAITNAGAVDPGIGYGFQKDGKTAESIPFSLMLTGAMFSQDAAGDLSVVLGTPVTVTPVSSIPDLPFSKGFLAAVQIGPEGLLMEMPGTLTITLPGVVNVSTLIGFAADGSGANFHLFPVTVYPDASGGTTSVYFSIEHFSLYGVAQATAQEVQAQLGHPPAGPARQDEGEQAPPTPILNSDTLAPLPTTVQLLLGKSYNRLVKPYLSNLANVPCNQVDVAAYQFNAWQAKVQMTNQGDFYQEQITKDGTDLLARLTACARVTCDSCVNNTNGKALDTTSANHLLVLAAFAGDIASLLGNTDESSYWMRLSMKCSAEAGMPPLYVSTGGDAPVGEAPSPVPLVCK
jgi:hypothetical protein